MAYHLGLDMDRGVPMRIARSIVHVSPDGEPYSGRAPSQTSRRGAMLAAKSITA